MSPYINLKHQKFTENGPEAALIKERAAEAIHEIIRHQKSAKIAICSLLLASWRTSAISGERNVLVYGNAGNVRHGVNQSDSACSYSAAI